MENTTIVCYCGGTAGDIVSLILDPSDLTNERQRFKKPKLFKTDEDKDNFIKSVVWKSIPSHDFEYHRRKKHKILGIVCKEIDSALWAASRFKQLHRPHVWEEMTNHCGANSVELYAQSIIDFGNMIEQYTDNVLYLESIRSGNAIIDLQKNGYSTPGQQLYNDWLLNKYT